MTSQLPPSRRDSPTVALGDRLAVGDPIFVETQARGGFASARRMASRVAGWNAVGFARRIRWKEWGIELLCVLLVIVLWVGIHRRLLWNELSLVALAAGLLTGAATLNWRRRGVFRLVGGLILAMLGGALVVGLFSPLARNGFHRLAVAQRIRSAGGTVSAQGSNRWPSAWQTIEFDGQVLVNPSLLFDFLDGGVFFPTGCHYTLPGHLLADETLDLSCLLGTLEITKLKDGEPLPSIAAVQAYAAHVVNSWNEVDLTGWPPELIEQICPPVARFAGITLEQSRALVLNSPRVPQFVCFTNLHDGHSQAIANLSGKGIRFLMFHDIDWSPQLATAVAGLKAPYMVTMEKGASAESLAAMSGARSTVYFGPPRRWTPTRRRRWEP